MIEEVSTLVDKYKDWLKDKTALRMVNGSVEITTPFLDRHNDYMQIYVKKNGNEFTLTDDGYTIQDLEISGCSLETAKRKSLLKLTLAGFGIQQNEDELFVKTTPEKFSLRKHNLIQAMLAVNDLFYLAQPYVSSFFIEDVSAWLDEIETRYIGGTGTKFTGKSGIDHQFDFVIPKSKNAPERFLKVINNPTIESAETTCFAWVDTKEVRKTDSTAFAVLNDNEKSINPRIEEALKSYDVIPLVWSKKYQFSEKLRA